MTGVRAQVNLLVTGTAAVVLLAFLAPLGIVLRSGAEVRAIADATGRAQSAATLVALGRVPQDSSGGLTVFYPGGATAGARAVRTDSVELAARGWSFAAQAPGGVEVMVPVQGLADGTAVVRVFVPDADRHRGVLGTWLLLAGIGAILLALSLFLADRLGRRLVGSVTDLASTADRLAAGELDARVTPGHTPELRRVGVELNRLAARIQQLLQAGRDEVADLAHRLRTPVTALRLDVDAVRDPQQQARLSADVDALTREVDELIRTARRPVREGAGAQADVIAVVAERTAFWSALAEDSGRSLELLLPPGPILVRVAPADLAAALDALLGNVFSHTPDGTPMRVAVLPAPDAAHVRVEDGGGGFTPGRSPGAGTGLGLDIARRTAEAALGTLRLGPSDLGGARIELTLPHPGPTLTGQAPGIGT